FGRPGVAADPYAPPFPAPPTAPLPPVPPPPPALPALPPRPTFAAERAALRFLDHAGSWFIVCSFLALLNLATSPRAFWAAWVAIPWGFVVALEFVKLLTTVVRAHGERPAGSPYPAFGSGSPRAFALPDVRESGYRFLHKAGSFVVGSLFLAAINAMTSGSPWCLWVILPWGMALAFDAQRFGLRRLLRARWLPADARDAAGAASDDPAFTGAPASLSAGGSAEAGELAPPRQGRRLSAIATLGCLSVLVVAPLALGFAVVCGVWLALHVPSIAPSLLQEIPGLTTEIILDAVILLSGLCFLASLGLLFLSRLGSWAFRRNPGRLVGAPAVRWCGRLGTLLLVCSLGVGASLVVQPETHAAIEGLISQVRVRTSSRTFTYPLPAGGPRALVIRNPHGGVTLRPVAGDQLTISTELALSIFSARRPSSQLSAWIAEPPVTVRADDSTLDVAVGEAFGAGGVPEIGPAPAGAAPPVPARTGPAIDVVIGIPSACASSIEVREAGPSGRRGLFGRRAGSDGGVRLFSLSVPVRVLAEGAASVSAERLGAGIEVRSVSGDVVLEQIGGMVSVVSVSGDVVVDDASSNVKVETQSGDVEISNALAALSVRTTSGEIDVHSARTPADDWKLTSVSGEVRATIPEDSRGPCMSIEFRTLGGPILAPGTKFQILSQDRGRLVRFTRDGNAPTLRVTTESGGLSLR
ncbi:MAG: 2TM domain-containing protein, partial [Planctomycetes bacterium]|nr:2TM domain-containing protein [Planctomycetota bacterium]